MCRSVAIAWRRRSTDYHFDLCVHKQLFWKQKEKVFLDVSPATLQTQLKTTSWYLLERRSTRTFIFSVAHSCEYFFLESVTGKHLPVEWRVGDDEKCFFSARLFSQAVISVVCFEKLVWWIKLKEALYRRLRTRRASWNCDVVDETSYYRIDYWTTMALQNNQFLVIKPWINQPSRFIPPGSLCYKQYKQNIPCCLIHTNYENKSSRHWCQL